MEKPKGLMRKKSKEDEKSLAELNSAYRCSQAKCQLLSVVQTIFDSLSSSKTTCPCLHEGHSNDSNTAARMAISINRNPFTCSSSSSFLSFEESLDSAFILRTEAGKFLKLAAFSVSTCSSSPLESPLVSGKASFLDCSVSIFFVFFWYRFPLNLFFFLGILRNFFLGGIFCEISDQTMFYEPIASTFYFRLRKHVI